MVPPALTPTKIVIAPAKPWAPDVLVKQSSHQMPETPPTVPLVVLVLGQVLMSGNWLVSDWSAVSFICCADCAICAPLLITTVPLPAGLVTCSVGSLVVATQPAGTVTDTADVDAVVGPPLPGVC